MKITKKEIFNQKTITIFSVILTVAVIVGIGIAVFSPKKGSTKSKKSFAGYVVGYLPYYSAKDADRVDYAALTHLNIAFANPDGNGQLYLEMSDETIKSIVQKCHDEDVKAILSLGGGSISSTNYNALMRGKPEGITAFNQQIIDFCKRYEFDGVDVDFEFIASSPAWEYFEDWILALRKQCDKNDLLLTAAVATWYSDNISDKAMKCFDYIMVMAYDNDGDSENHSKYSYAESEMQHYEKRGIDKQKLILGVPFYGYRYTSSGKMDWNSGASYRYILSLDKAASESDYAQGFAYNGPDTIRQKAKLSKDYGGIMIWELSQDADGSDSLLKVIKSVYQ
ncbi:MAG: hypothetical protein IKE65_10100 [Clostridia bacterium]|nr:hypothetical protein [Clostridia bacterium]